MGVHKHHGNIKTQLDVQGLTWKTKFSCANQEHWTEWEGQVLWRINLCRFTLLHMI